MQSSIGLYIHIPFCKNKCPYCDFYSVKITETLLDEYVAELTDKIKYWSEKCDKALKTVYFGGGTPSVLGAERLCEILNEIKKNFEVEESAEITVEVNPDSGKTIDFSLLKENGFNRISVGMQTAVDRELKELGRIHSADEARLTVERAKKAGIGNISLDLMMGIPFQTKDSLKESIEFCKNCGVTHISSYILKIEENTRFAKIKDTLSLADEDEQADLYLYAVELLESSGFMQYEISNFAIKGFESRHNTSYWKCEEYIGIGPSAHSFFEGKRFYYGRSFDDFYENKIIYDCDGGDEAEYIMLSLRLKSGLNFDEFKYRFQKDIPSYILKKAEKYIKLGFMTKTDNSICFTPEGYLVSNSIIAELL
ncbi:MAG: radical SAM family heme chaperone HemW [Ruminococcus sp.]|nr:radical SAM family heme chaperone HemW [Ruminococcus sp.]